MKKFTTKTAQETETLGHTIGRQLKGGETIELISDLGGGKTTLVRGLTKGAGSPDHVSSPTFTISKMYQAPELTIHHFDFYRIPEPGLVGYELIEVIQDPKAVVIVEWAEAVQEVLPEKRLTVNIRNLDEQQRQLEFSYPDSLEYLLNAVPYSDQDNT